MKIHARPFLSIVVPAYNEAENLPTAVATLLAQASPHCDAVEIIVVNDGSKDATAAVMNTLQAQYTQLRCINFARNFGKEAALEAGLEHAKGDAVLFIDADLQHPPSLMPEMIEAWCKGADVVNAKKRDRGEESAAYGFASKLFYRLFSRATGVDFRGASDYKLIDRQVVEAIKQCRERDRFFRGLVAWVGFRQVDVLFDVQPRVAGESTWSTYGLIRYSISNLLAFSSLPLTFIAIAGLVMSLVSVVLCAETLLRYLLGASLSGFTTVIISQTAFSAVILLAVGVLAIYVGRMYDEQKGRPLYIVRQDSVRDREGSRAQVSEQTHSPAQAIEPD
ncbi:glycosyltransferase family 2 protein [Caballeronia sp. LjRoot29]|uniref:glycosyltransferase family 2 protein n=1 Tax=Caballeronia sp. LjRoot29 TaxID=3342315 RepID=UPI003ED15215